MKLKLYILCIGLICTIFGAKAQYKISGTVKDAENGKSMEVANVVILNGPRTVDFVSTNEKGEFAFSLKNNPDSLTLYVSSLGYQHYKRRIGTQRNFAVSLKPQSVNLKEVTIHGGRVWGRNDTIKYDASKFLRAGDKTVEDLFKRLPGVDVDDNGKIKFKGKDVGKVYVEGLDMLGDRYKSISKNLSASAIKGVDVLDNHQRIKSLVGKIPSEVPDINLRLKDDFKDKWNFNAKAAAGFSAEQVLCELEATAVQISKKSQSLYSLKLSNTGNGITKEADESYDGQMLFVPEYKLLTTGNISAPLKERRWLFDDAALASANRLYKTGEDSQIKLNAFYTHDDIRQHQSEITSYFNPADTVRIEENQFSRLKMDKVNISADYEDNNETYFLRNKLEISLGKLSELTDILGTNALSQQKLNDYLLLKNNINANRTLKNGNMVRGQSVLSYWTNREKLNFYNHLFPYNSQGFYAVAQGSIRIGKTKIAQEYKLGSKVDLNLYQKMIDVWIDPLYEYLFGDFRLNASLPAHLDYLIHRQKWIYLPAANFGVTYSPNPAWKFYGYASFSKKLGEIISFYQKTYFADYRTEIVNEKGIPLSHQQYYSLRGEYKNTLKEFFITAHAKYSRTQSNNTLEQKVSDSLIQVVRQYQPHNESFASVNSVISKGFYNLHAKVSIEVNWTDFLSSQLRNGDLIPYTFQNFRLTPKFSIALTKHIDVSYSADISRMASSFGYSKTNPLWNIGNKLNVGYTKGNFYMNATGEYYHNQLTSNQALDLFFADLNMEYKLKKAYLTLQVNNIFNQKEYKSTLYNPLSVYQSQFSLRPREVLLSAKFSF